MAESILDPSEKAKLNMERKVAKKGDLYNALHRVGDDDSKAIIEDVLEDVLSPTAFKTVLAVFNLGTNWKDEV